jgi:adenine-specific DNA-methyltransferase
MSVSLYSYQSAAEDVVMECRDNLAFMRTLKTASMNLIVTSPPYNIGKEYEKRSSLNANVQENMKVISECVRVLNLQGSLCWQVGNHVDNGEIVPLGTVLYPVFKAHGLKLRNRIVWHFEHVLHCSKRLSGRYETILWFTSNPLGKNPGDVWIFPNVKNHHMEKTIHPCQFSIELAIIPVAYAKGIITHSRA